MQRALSFFFLVILTLLPAVRAQRRGGDGGGGDDGGDGGGGGGGGDGGQAWEEEQKQRACRNFVARESPNWIHRYVGSYFNGTIEVTLTVNSSEAQCDAQRATLSEQNTGVLSLLDPRYNGRQDVNVHAVQPFSYVLLGWPRSATEDDLFALRRSEAAVPEVVRVRVESQAGLRRDTMDRLYGESSRRTHYPACEVSNLTETSSGYGFECLNHGRFNHDPSQIHVYMNPCNGSAATHRFAALPGGYTRMVGSFDPDEADFRWEGDFSGFFADSLTLAMHGSRTREDPPLLHGNFTMRFRGTIDKENSYEMRVQRGKNVTWVDDEEKLEAAMPKCSGSTRRLPLALVGLLALLAIP